MLFWTWKERLPHRRHRVCDLVWRRPKLPVPAGRGRRAGQRAAARQAARSRGCPAWAGRGLAWRPAVATSPPPAACPRHAAPSGGEGGLPSAHLCRTCPSWVVLVTERTGCPTDAKEADGGAGGRPWGAGGTQPGCVHAPLAKHFGGAPGACLAAAETLQSIEMQLAAPVLKAPPVASAAMQPLNLCPPDVPCFFALTTACTSQATWCAPSTAHCPTRHQAALAAAPAGTPEAAARWRPTCAGWSVPRPLPAPAVLLIMSINRRDRQHCHAVAAASYRHRRLLPPTVPWGRSARRGAALRSWRPEQPLALWHHHIACMLDTAWFTCV